MQYQSKPKSATTAGLLGIFLGAFGAHSWYLENKKNAMIHLGLTVSGVAIQIIAVLLPLFFANSLSGLLFLATVSSALIGIGGMLCFASGVWGLVEGIIILANGDAGLAQKGYNVSQAYVVPGQPVAYPAQQPNQTATNGYQQPMGQNPYPGAGFSQPNPTPVQPTQAFDPTQSQYQQAQPVQPVQYTQPDPAQSTQPTPSIPNNFNQTEPYQDSNNQNLGVNHG